MRIELQHVLVEMVVSLGSCCISVLRAYVFRYVAAQLWVDYSTSYYLLQNSLLFALALDYPVTFHQISITDIQCSDDRKPCQPDAPCKYSKFFLQYDVILNTLRMRFLNIEILNSRVELGFDVIDELLFINVRTSSEYRSGEIVDV